MKIYKYVISKIKEPCQISLPKNYQIIHFGHQEGELIFWAIVNPENPQVNSTFIVLGTGDTIPEIFPDLKYVGTTQIKSPAANLVWHLFESK